jgi:predicted Fe-Mo cluster-binding NifX family protein
MLILVPVMGEDPKHSRITTRAQAEKWALIDFEDGEVKSVTFHDDRESTGADWIDFVVLENRYENYMDLMEEGIMVLVRREEQDTLELIVEAFKFKELDEAGF